MVAGGPLPTERSTQRSILKMCGTCFPHTVIHHAAVTMLAGTGKQRGMQMGAMKGDGFKPGWPDLIILWACGKGGLFEVKREFGPRGGGGGVVSEAQIDLHVKLAGIGWPVAIVRTVDEAYMQLREWGAPWSGIDPRIVRLVDAYHPVLS